MMHRYTHRDSEVRDRTPQRRGATTGTAAGAPPNDNLNAFFCIQPHTKINTFWNICIDDINRCARIIIKLQWSRLKLKAFLYICI